MWLFKVVTKLQWPSVVLLVAVICALVACAALGLTKEAIAIVGSLGALLTAIAPAIGSRDDHDALPPDGES